MNSFSSSLSFSTGFSYTSRSRNSSGSSSSSSSSTCSFLEDENQYQKVVNQLVLNITEENGEMLPLKPKHLKLLFGTNTEKRISGMTGLNFCGSVSESDKLDTTIFSYYDFPPEEEAKLLALVDYQSTSHLTVAINDYEDSLPLDSVRRLIGELALADTPLISLQLYVNWSQDVKVRRGNFSPSIVHALSLFLLLESLNCLKNLQRLTVIVDHCVFGSIPADNVNCQVDLSPLLCRLLEFNWSTGDELQTTPVLGWLAKTASETAEGEPLSLQTIRIGNPDLRHTLTDFTEKFPGIGPLIIDLPRVFWSNPTVFVSRSLSMLPSLTHLSLRAHCTEHLFGLLHSIRPLTHSLQSLSIVLNTSSPTTGHVPLSAFSAHHILLLPTAFSSLRSLKLVANVRSHSDLHSPLWSVLFPSLEHLDLTHNCLDCAFCPNRPGRLTNKAQAKVARLFEEHLFPPFSYCPQLCSVNVKKNGGKWAQSYVITAVNQWRVPLKVGGSRSSRGSRSSSSSSQ